MKYAETGVEFGFESTKNDKWPRHSPSHCPHIFICELLTFALTLIAIIPTIKDHEIRNYKKSKATQELTVATIEKLPKDLGDECKEDIIENWMKLSDLCRDQFKGYAKYNQMSLRNH